MGKSSSVKQELDSNASDYLNQQKQKRQLSLCQVAVLDAG